MITRLLLAAALVVTPAIALAVPASAVTPVCGQTVQCTTTYYNNSAHTKVVGSRTINCDGQTIISGKTSDYLSLQLTACPGGGE
jgi:NAD kinase